MYDENQLGVAVYPFAQRLQDQRFADVDTLDNTALCRAILAGDERAMDAFAGAVANCVWGDERPMSFATAQNPGVLRVLGLPEDTILFVYTPHYGMTHKPTDPEGLTAMWGNTHYFRVTAVGIKYAGQVTLEQMLVAAH